MTIAPRPKRRSRPSLAARLRRFWLLGVAVLLLGLWGGFALATSSAFRLHQLTITPLMHVGLGDVLARAEIDPRTNVWLLDRGAISRRIEALPYVATARVHPRLLGNVLIDITERTAAGCVRSTGGRTLTIDRENRVLERGCVATIPIAYVVRAALADPPGRYVRNAELAALERDARALALRGEQFRTLRHDAFGGLEADLPDGVRVRFGDDRDLARKQQLIAPIFTGLGARAARVRAVDLRAPATPVLEFRAASSSPKPTLHTHYTQGTHRADHNI